MNFSKKVTTAYLAFFLTMLVGCSTTESKKEVVPDQVASYDTSYSGPRSTLVVGQFANRSNYLQGIFSSGNDRLGDQARTILKSHLQQTNRFKLVDRENMTELQAESEISGLKQKLAGARYVVDGAVTEFGRKSVGDKQLFGILGAGKKQIAYAVVTLNIVDVLTSEIVYSVQGGGEYALSEREVLGFGSNASYDATLNGKVLNFAITKAVDGLVKGIESGRWRPSVDNNPINENVVRDPV